MAFGLGVRVTNATDGTCKDYHFRRLPVRIGRNPLNDLTLDFPFVSQFHAVLELDGPRLMLRDLGSTNGTHLRQVGRVPPNQVINLAEHGFEFAVLSLIFRTFTVEIPDDAGLPTSRRPLGVTNMFALKPDVAEGAAPDRVAGIMSQFVGSYASYRVAWKELLGKLAKSVAELPPNHGPELVARLAREYPALATEPDFRSLAAQHGVALAGETVSPEAVALRGLRELAEDFTPEVGAPETPADLVAFLGRLQATLDVFLRSFVPLRDGYKQFEVEMAIRRADRMSGAPPVGMSAADARDAKELALLLLDWRARTGDAFAVIESTFADLMIHQVAMLNGVMTGVRNLLQELSPAGIEAQAQGSGLQVGPFRYQSLWKAYEKRYADVAEDEKQVFSLLFGKQFARAYDRYRDVEHTSAVQLPSVWPKREG